MKPQKEKTNPNKPLAEEIVKKIYQEAELGLCDIKPMFGGYGLSLEQFFFGIITDLGNGPTLYLKTNPETEAEFLAYGGVPFTYRAKGQPRQLQYHSLPEQAFNKTQIFKHFIRLGLAAAMEK